MTQNDSQVTIQLISDESSLPPSRLRAALYVDGMNMYHALDDLKRPYLKWLNLAALARLLVVGKPENVSRIIFCTAINNKDALKQTRHRQYIRALETENVVVVKGHFSSEPRNCKNCRDKWDHPTEKEGDTSLSITIIDDAHRDVFDVAYLLTSDGDQAPVARMIKAGFPNKRLVTVAPPGRTHNYKILNEAHGKASVTADLAEKCLFGRAVKDLSGNMIIRPTDYDPPLGWIAPNLRPKKAS